MMKIIDLTHSIAENMPMYPGTDAPTLHVAYNHEDYGFMETHISLFSHTGTHIDAPAHLYANGLTLDKYPIEQFVGKALVIDCRKLEKGEKIQMQLLEEKGDVLHEVEFILFLTGQSALWGTPEYFGKIPLMSQEVVEWINQRKLKGIGIDAPSFDPITIDALAQAAGELDNHRAILKTNNTILIENLCKLEEVGSEMFMLYALPLNTSNADGAPARVIAMVNNI
ncbi:MAG: cyclase family protein [Bacteroidetes bacterium]|nr:cyclase family protein [Bacteroidota bacterium]MCL2301942.1 cyclase family protein [Lentimicrobiaceae bacterium]